MMQDAWKMQPQPTKRPPCPKCGRPMEYAEPPMVTLASWGCSNCWLTPIPAKYFEKKAKP